MINSAPVDLIEKQKNHQIWWQLAILVVISALAVYAGKAFNEQLDNYLPETQPISSTFNKKQSGISGLSEVLKKVGLPTRAWLLPYRNLKAAHGTLVIIAPVESPQEFEAEQILRWVEAGNSLVYLDHFTFKMTRRLLEKMKVEIRDSTDLKDKRIPTDSNERLFAFVPKLTISSDTALTGGRPVVAFSNRSIFSEFIYGKGRILLGTSPNLCTNQRLTDKDNWSNFQFLFNWLGTTNGDIMFDERCHGFSQSGNVFAVLLHSPWGAVFYQCSLILMVAIYSASKRFGALELLKNARKISNMEFINGLSNAYLRAKANSAILEITGQNLRNRICKQLMISPHEPTEKIVQVWTDWVLMNPTKMIGHKELVPKFLKEYDGALLNKNITDAQFKALIADCDTITALLSTESA